MTPIRDLLRDLAAGDPGRPRLTWYGPGSERVELSGRVLLNGVTKATNLLVDAGDVGPGVIVSLDVPPHWRALVWALAAWNAGGQVVADPAGGEAAVVITDRPDAHGPPSTAELVVAVPLPALALRFPGDLPPGALDGAADLMTYPDAPGRLEPVAPEDPAWSAPGEPPVTHHDLVTWARGVAGSQSWPATPRVLATAGTLPAVAAAALAAWAADGSLVLLGGDAPAQVAEQEKVDVRV